MTLSAPEPITTEHDIDHFVCGVSILDEWLRRRAHANQLSGASRTFVITNDRQVVGYYSIAAGALGTTDAPGALRRNMPDPIPMAVLGRLAVDASWHGKGLGVALLQDATLRAARAAEIIGMRGILVHAVSEEARRFYLRHGFVDSPTKPMTLVLSLKGQF